MDAKRSDIPDGSHDAADAPAAEGDLTGRRHMTSNILASWGAQMVFIAAGFILPRMINGHRGQEALGVWDLGWAFLTWFGIASVGVMSSINRYVARYRSVNDREMLNTTVGTGLAIYMCTSMIVLALTVGAAALLPTVYANKLGDYPPASAQWMVLLLGLSLVVQFVFAVFNGVITGCNRWGAHNGIHAGTYLLMTAGMIAALLLGGGLPVLAGIILTGEVLAGLLRVVAAKRFCPELTISLRYARRHHVATLIHFGGKSMLMTISQVILYQANVLLLGGYLGMAVVALYSRAAALVRNVNTLLIKFANVFTPTASALEAQGKKSALRDLLIKGTRFGLYFSLPLVVLMTLSGKAILLIWMKDKAFAAGQVVLAVMAIGHLALFSQRATWQILMGLGRHGLPGVAMLAAAVCAAPLSILGIGVLDWGMLGAALAVVIPLTVVNAVVVPWYACRILDLSYWKYFASSVPGPAVAMLPYAACLLVGNELFPDSPFLSLAMGFGSGCIVLGVIYWRYAIPDGLRRKIASKLARLLGRPATKRP